MPRVRPFEKPIWDKGERIPFRSLVFGSGHIIAYRTRGRGAQRVLDVIVEREDGRREIIEGLCRCDQCVRSWEIQSLVAEASWKYETGYNTGGPIRTTRGGWCVFSKNAKPFRYAEKK